jgi:hypothetical protein
LEVGEISGIVSSDSGYHLIYRIAWWFHNHENANYGWKSKIYNVHEIMMERSLQDI